MEDERLESANVLYLLSLMLLYFSFSLVLSCPWPDSTSTAPQTPVSREGRCQNKNNHSLSDGLFHPVCGS